LCIVHAAPLVVVFAYTRLDSLRRLIESVNGSVPTHTAVDLRICCDVAAGTHDGATANYVRSLHWQRGDYTFLVHKSNVGLTEQWLNCWNGAHDNALLLEDDMQLAPYALQWLTSARERYRNDASVIGFSLQRQTNCFHLRDCAQNTISIPWSVTEYKYLLVGTWGYAPVREHWQRFRAWYAQVSLDRGYVPQVEHLLPSQWYQSFVAQGTQSSMWEMWFIKFCDIFKLYTVYYQHPSDETLCTHWAEPGLHYSGAAKADFPALASAALMPTTASMIALGWDGRIDTNALHEYEVDNIVTQLKLVLPKQPLLTFVNYGFKAMVEHFLCNIERVAPTLLSQMCFVAIDRQMYAYLQAAQMRWGFAVAPFSGTASLSGDHVMWNTVGYNTIILQRTRAVQRILDAGIPLLLFEADAYVRGNFVTEFVRHADVDIVGVRETFNRPLINGGFLLLRNSTRTRAVWSSVVASFEHHMQPFVGKPEHQPAQPYNEQELLSALVAEGAFGVRSHTLDTNRFLSGEAFTDHRTGLIADAELILFTYAVGNAAKRNRALKHKLWYILQNNTLCHTGN
jgi:hypothetical protein